MTTTAHPLWIPFNGREAVDFYRYHLSGGGYIDLHSSGFAAGYGGGFTWVHCTAKPRGRAAEGSDRASLLAYCKRERITLPELPVEWCPDEEPNADGWIPWCGGECPVPPVCEVLVRLRCGDSINGRAGTLHWEHLRMIPAADIVAYRTISNPEPAEEPEADTAAAQMQTTRDRLLNLADRMWFSDKPAASFAFDLRKLARELDGGDQ